MHRLVVQSDRIRTTIRHFLTVVRNDTHCHAIVEHILRLVCALFTQVTRQIVRDTAQRIFKFFENLGTHFYTYHASPRNPTHTVGTGTSNSIIGTHNCGTLREPFVGKCQGSFVCKIL